MYADRHKMLTSPIMHLSRSTYRNFSILALIVLMALPCPVRREIKHWLNIDLNQAAKQTSGSQKTCVPNSSFCSFAQTHTQQKKQRQTPSFENAANPHLANTRISGDEILLPDTHNRFKEKIPSFLRFGQFLI
ncbi:MAG: hypothetical protein H6Q14_2866 [Bacteroidetes bacterium]|nr:hypothetical protein [Bacteroidota bacterium]